MVKQNIGPRCHLGVLSTWTSILCLKTFCKEQPEMVSTSCLCNTGRAMLRTVLYMSHHLGGAVAAAMTSKQLVDIVVHAVYCLQQL